MRPLFSPTGMKMLESFSFIRALYAFDFDGTLARIVRVPAHAAMEPLVAELLRQLSLRAPVAIISGRSLSDLRERLDFTPQFVIGNYGLEGLARSSDQGSSAYRSCRGWLEKLERAFSEGALEPGVEIEDKRYSLALHYRKSPSWKAAKAGILAAVAGCDPRPLVVTGKAVINLLPEGGPHKGMALLELMSRNGIGSALYVGDDDTDEAVFTLPTSRVLTVRVCRSRTSAAQYYISAQTDMRRLLRTLVRFHSEGSAAQQGSMGQDGRV